MYAHNYMGYPLWLPAQVTEVTGPCSYRVELEDGRVWHCHINQLWSHLRATSHNQTDEMAQQPSTTEWRGRGTRETVPVGLNCESLETPAAEALLLPQTIPDEDSTQMTSGEAEAQLSALHADSSQMRREPEDSNQAPAVAVQNEGDQQVSAQPPLAYLEDYTCCVRSGVCWCQLGGEGCHSGLRIGAGKYFKPIG